MNLSFHIVHLPAQRSGTRIPSAHDQASKSATPAFREPWPPDVRSIRLVAGECLPPRKGSECDQPPACDLHNRWSQSTRYPIIPTKCPQRTSKVRLQSCQHFDPLKQRSHIHCGRQRQPQVGTKIVGKVQPDRPHPTQLGPRAERCSRGSPCAAMLISGYGECLSTLASLGLTFCALGSPQTMRPKDRRTPSLGLIILTYLRHTIET